MVLDGILTFPQQLCHLAASKVFILTKDVDDLGSFVDFFWVAIWVVFWVVLKKVTRNPSWISSNDGSFSPYDLMDSNTKTKGTLPFRKERERLASALTYLCS